MKKNLLSAVLFAALSLGLSGCWCDGYCHEDWNDWNDDCWSRSDCHQQDQDCYWDSWNDNWVCTDVGPQDPHGHGDTSCIWNSDCPSTKPFCENNVCVAQETPVEPVPECVKNSDCKSDEICTEGRCIPCQTEVCDTSKEIECVFSTQCESGLCVDGVCLATGKCAVDSNCKEGQICNNGTCVARPECMSDRECGEGRICNASGECEDDVECRKDSDCGKGMLCLSNMCAQCRLNCECPNDGDICMNGVCVSGQ